VADEAGIVELVCDIDVGFDFGLRDGVGVPKLAERDLGRI
jgi:hypothetical protein